MPGVGDLAFRVSGGEATTGGVILSSGGGPGLWPDAGVRGCIDASAGAGPGGGVAICGGLISNDGVVLGEDWAIEIFGGQVTGASASATPQAWVSVNLPDWGPGGGGSVEEAGMILATAVGG